MPPIHDTGGTELEDIKRRLEQCSTLGIPDPYKSRVREAFFTDDAVEALRSAVRVATEAVVHYKRLIAQCMRLAEDIIDRLSASGKPIVFTTKKTEKGERLLYYQHHVLGVEKSDDRYILVERMSRPRPVKPDTLEEMYADMIVLLISAYNSLAYHYSLRKAAEKLLERLEKRLGRGGG